MANAKIDVVGPGEIPLVADLYSQVFKPVRESDFFQRRFKGRQHELILIATVEERAVGFLLGFELKPGTFFTWLVGVLPDYRRQGIASQLLEAAHAWAQQNDYELSRFECHNQHRPMLHLAVEQGYDIVGIRWDHDRAANLVILEKVLEG